MVPNIIRSGSANLVHRFAHFLDSDWKMVGKRSFINHKLLASTFNLLACCSCRCLCVGSWSTPAREGMGWWTPRPRWTGSLQRWSVSWSDSWWSERFCVYDGVSVKNAVGSLDGYIQNNIIFENSKF